jgi:transposase
MDVMFTHCAGLDVHKKTVMACRVTPDPSGQQADGIMELQEFGTMTRDLLALSDWLAEVGVTHVAMESTGEYWRPIYNLLEGTFTVLLVNAAHVKQVPGRKTDKADARWLAKLMRYGLLAASFIPPQGQRDLRDLTRYRTKLVQERSREVNRGQGVLGGPTSSWPPWRRTSWASRAGRSWRHWLPGEPTQRRWPSWPKVGCARSSRCWSRP